MSLHPPLNVVLSGKAKSETEDKCGQSMNRSNLGGNVIPEFSRSHFRHWSAGCQVGTFPSIKKAVAIGEDELQKLKNLVKPLRLAIR